MDFMKLLKSFEEFIFEAASWLIFYPLTLGRIMLHPLKAMEYSDREQAAEREHAYDDALSPPLLLLVTIVLANLISAAAHLPSPNATSETLKTISSNQQNLILFRSLVFSLVPLVSAGSLVRRQGKKLSRQTLRAPFYAQCYLAALCAASFALGEIFLQRSDLNSAVGWVIMAFGSVWFLNIQSAWFARKLGVSRRRGIAIALWNAVRALAYLVVLMIPIAYI